MSDLPEGWSHRRLDEVAAVLSGSSPRSDTFSHDMQSGIPFLQGNAEFGDRHPTPLRTTNDPKRLAPQGSVLVSVRAPVGATNVASAEVAIGRGLASVVPGPELDRDFLLWSMLANRSRLEGLATGTTFAAVTGPVLRSFAIPVPDLHVQKAVVQRLDALVAIADRGAQSCGSSSQLARQLRRSLLKQLVEASGQTTPIGELGSVFVGMTPKRAEPHLWEGDIPWVSSGEVAFGTVTTTKETIAEAALAGNTKRLHPPGTVLLAMYGEGKTRGQAAMLGIPAATNQAVAAIRVDPARMRPAFLYLCLRAKYAEIREIGQGGNQKNLNGNLVRAIEVPCPSLSLQDELVTRAEAEERRIAELETDGLLVEQRIRSLRAALVHRAMAGQL